MFSLILFVAFFATSVFAQSGNVKFHNINEIYGISMRETASVCKDDNGFIWTSSKTGILRIMGDDFRIYQLPFQSFNIFNVKLVSKNSMLYAYSSNGQVFVYNPLFDRFDILFDMNKMLDGQHRLYVASIFIDHRNNIWIPSNLGFYLYQDGELRKTNAPESEVMRVTAIDDQRLALVSTDGIYLMDVDHLEIKSVCEFPTALRVSLLYFDAAINRLWVGTMSNGLYYYCFTNNVLNQLSNQIVPRQPVLAIEIASDSTFYVGIDGQGIRELDKTGARVIQIHKENLDDNFSIRGNGVYDIFNDTENRKVWVCTYSGGLSFFEESPPQVQQIEHKINNTNSLANNNVNQIIEDARGNIWFATENGISRWNVQQDKWQTFFHNKQEQAQVFLSLCEDDAHRIWAGSYSSGVYVLDGKTGHVLAQYSKGEQTSSFDCNFTFDIIKDSKGVLWLGGVNDGLFRYDPKERDFEAFPEITMYSLTELSDDKMLAACNIGIYQLDTQTREIQMLTGGYMVVDILFANGSVWMCTQGNGLVEYDPETKTTREYTTMSGLLSDYVNSIIFANGYLWLGTEAGLCQFNPTDKTVINFSSLLPNISFNRNAVCRLSNGQLAWGTSHGAIIFDPASLQQTPPIGRIFVQDILVSGRSVREEAVFELKTPLDSLQEITLRYNRNNLAMELIPLGNASDFKFAWMLEGFDTKQNHPSNDRKLMYTNIPTGKFILKISMYDHSLAQLIDERRLYIRIMPPFWESWWLRLILTAMTIGIIFVSLRFYINRLRQYHTEEKIRFFTNMAHEIRTAITLIKAPIDEIGRINFTETDNKYLDIVAEQARRLSSTVTHLLDFQKADVGKEQLSLKMVNVVELIEHRRLMFESFAKSKSVELVFTARPAKYPTAIDRTMMEKVIDNLISNAIKYSYADRRVEIIFTGDEKRWTLEVKDYGIGISMRSQRKLFREFYRSDNAINFSNVGSGIGLLLAKNYITLHGGTIRCNSRENAGSTFTISVPFRKIETPEKEHSISIEHPILKTENNDDFPKKMNLLIVEDNEDLQKFMSIALCEEFTISTANDGATAWDVIQKQLPDLVISDVMMPNMDGFELCRLIKSTYETSHIPVVLLTALADKAEQLHGFGLGADSYLTKPFDMELVTQRIRSMIQNRRAVREKAFKLLGKNTNETLFTNELNDQFMKKAALAVRENMGNENFDKEEFAAAMCVSSSLLYKKIKSLTGQSPIDFVKAMRLNHARDLLQTGKFTVTEVSEICGFTSLNYFGKTFKKYFGKLPSEVMIS